MLGSTVSGAADAALDAVVFALPVDPPEQAVMIGDSNVDIRTAKNAGVHSIGCTWGFRGRDELAEAGADDLAEKPEDLLKFTLM